jgi:predicted DNA-binding transcriptional regulator AlpA
MRTRLDYEITPHYVDLFAMPARRVNDSTPNIFNRRVNRREFRTLLGVGVTWFRELQKRGVIPPGRHDHGGRRLWWTQAEVDDTLARIAAAAARDVDDKAAAAGRVTNKNPRGNTR